MNKLYAWFPLSASVLPGQLKTLITSLVIYLLASAVLCVLNLVLGWIPLVGWLLELLFSLLGIYCVAGILLCIWRFVQRG